MTTRRAFIRQAAGGATLISFGHYLPGLKASSYRRIIGANDRINIAVMGVNSRGSALAGSFARVDNVDITAICDVDT
ncbi:MAG TPA: gfo/Idh/MocA family oxidoreductase, partial [Bacteroidales bacterium]|nr:gfo/Idh/MocA family oxidoreductase [Bacteroidales bacterium]